MSLKLLVEKQNIMARLFKDTPWDINNIDQAVADSMFSRLDSDMSPECLYADGERPSAQAAKLAKQYQTAYRELRAKGFSPTAELYNF